MYDSLHNLILLALTEDGAEADITTLTTVPMEKTARGTIVARQSGIIAGLHVAIETFRVFDARIDIDLCVKDGDSVQAGQELVRLQGLARSLLSAERVALNFLGHLSGIASLTAYCVQALEGTSARILDTRKTTPGLRTLEKAAVSLGGGQNHRFGLNDGVLIKDNHIKAAGGIAQAIRAARQHAPHLLKIEIECETLAEVAEALQADADVILLDNMSLDLMHQSVELARSTNTRVLLEASGGIGTDRKKLADVAATGVDFISMGALTHSAPNFDVSLEFV
jgi:nicotinate-nucleotide pyrophosphorylase (carboxylating)